MSPQYQLEPAVELAAVGTCVVAQSWPVQLAGKLADLTVEHQKAVRLSDVSDPDPSEVARWIHEFQVPPHSCTISFLR